MNYDYKDIITSLKSVGIKKGNIIYLTGDLSLLGKFKDRSKTLPSFYKALKHVLGKQGTICFPTHSYYLVKNINSVFDIKKTPCESGVLPEFLRKLKNTHRQNHPYASTSSIGRHSKFIVSGSAENLWGPNSPFERLINLNAKILNFGLPPRYCCTSVHHAEQTSNVPYRYFKNFKQKVKIGKKIINKNFKMFVLKKDFINIKRNKNKKIFHHFCKNYQIKKYPLGKSFLYSYSLTDFFKDNIKYLKKNPYAWLGYDPTLEMEVKKITYKFLKLFKIRKGENIMLHSNIAGLYQFLSQHQTKKINYYFLNSLINFLGKSSTILIPSYNYDFAKGKIFDKYTSKSQVGDFSNFLIKHFPSSRSNEPIFNHLVFGKLKKKIFNCEINETFGNKSIFNFIKENNFKILCFCCPPSSMTFLHFIEKENKVPYRFNKSFKGQIKLKKKKINFNLKYYVGRLNEDHTIKEKNVTNLLKKRTNFKRNLGRFSCYSINAKTLSAIVSKKIKSDPHYLIK